MSGRALAAAALAILALLATAGCRTAKEPPVAPPNPLADSADQVMFGVRTFITDQGLLRAQLRADTGYFFDGNSRIEVRNERTVFFTNTGQQSAVLTSQEGTYSTTRSMMEARKNVVVISTDGKRLESSQLSFNQVTNLISSDSAFVLTEPERRVEGVGFTSDPSLSNFKILKLNKGAGPIPLSGQKP